METSLERLHSLLEQQPLAVVSTARDDEPYASLVAIAAEGPGSLLFGTPRATRKFGNLVGNERIAVLVDDRSNDASDTAEAAAATGVGVALELEGGARERALEALVRRHPHLRDFYVSPSVALVRVSLERWYIVTRFQSVMAFGPEDWSCDR